MATITKIEVRGFASLKQVSLDLPPLLALVGKNDTGKTNLLKAIRLLGALPRQELATALEAFGGIRGASWMGDSQTGVSIDVYGQLDHSDRTFGYSVHIVEHNGAPAVQTESLRIDDHVPAERVEEKIKLQQKPATLETGKSILYSVHTSSSAGATGRLVDWCRSAPVVEVARSLAALKIYNLSPASLRKPSPVTDTPQLAADGEGLATLLEMYAGHPDYQESFEQVVQDLRTIVPHFRRVGVRSVKNGDKVLKELQFRVEFENKPFSFTASQASDGLLLLLATLMLTRAPDAAPIILLEEPENGVHTSALAQLIEFLRQANPQGPGLLMTTHSPYLLDHLKPEEVCIVTRSDDGSTRLSMMADFPDLPKWRKGFSTGEIWTNLGESKLSETSG